MLIYYIWFLTLKDEKKYPKGTKRLFLVLGIGKLAIIILALIEAFSK